MIEYKTPKNTQVQIFMNSGPKDQKLSEGG